MTFIRKHSGDSTRLIVACYTCPEHGLFECEVQRDEKGEAPDYVECPVAVGWDGIADRPPGTFGPSDPGAPGMPLQEVYCEQPSTWTPSADIACRVRRVEVVRGKYEKPERKTYLDTRKLGEGQDPEEFRAEREKIWDERRREQIKGLL